jgi:hypothetical protein
MAYSFDYANVTGAAVGFDNDTQHADTIFALCASLLRDLSRRCGKCSRGRGTWRRVRLAAHLGNGFRSSRRRCVRWIDLRLCTI